MIGDSKNRTNFPHKLLLTDRQISRLHKVFANSSSTNIKFSKTQLPKMIHSGRIYADILSAILQVIFHTRVTAFKKADLVEVVTQYYVNKGVNKLCQLKVQEQN